MLKKLFRFGYRSPSLWEVLGFTKIKRNIKSKSGYYTVTKPGRVVTNLTKRVKYKVGYYSTAMRLLRRGVPGVNTVGRNK